VGAVPVLQIDGNVQAKLAPDFDQRHALRIVACGRQQVWRNRLRRCAATRSCVFALGASAPTKRHANRWLGRAEGADEVVIATTAGQPEAHTGRQRLEGDASVVARLWISVRSSAR